MTKALLVKDKNTNSYRLEYRTSETSDSLEAPVDPLTGEFENPEWLVIQEQVDLDGNLKKIAVVDKALKKQAKDLERTKKQTEKQERDAEREIKKEVNQFLRNFDKSSLASIDEIQDAINSIVKALKLINNSLKE